MSKMILRIDGNPVCEIPCTQTSVTLTKSTFSSEIVTAVIGVVSSTYFDGVDNWIEVKLPDKIYKVSVLGLIPWWSGTGNRVKVDMVTGTVERINQTTPTHPLLTNAGYFDRVRDLAKDIGMKAAWEQVEGELPYGLRRFTNYTCFERAKTLRLRGKMIRPKFVSE